jgi:hypothetical protein
MTPSVIAAVDGLKKAFPRATVTVLAEDGNGGAFVVVDGVELGPKFSPATTWFGAQLPASLPYADIYPLFMAPDVTRADGGSLSNGALQSVTWQNRAAIQVSRANRRMTGAQSAVSKFVKVIEFVRSLA